LKQLLSTVSIPLIIYTEVEEETKRHLEELKESLKEDPPSTAHSLGEKDTLEISASLKSLGSYNPHLVIMEGGTV
jgi:hypothetical protein